MVNGSQLIIGFDSAWTPNNKGAIVAVHRSSEGIFEVVTGPVPADFLTAERLIKNWQQKWPDSKTLILLDQPTIVRNASGQRPVENIVGSLVSRRLGGVQPANTSRLEMFGVDAPVWGFLRAFDDQEDTYSCSGRTVVRETYPTMVLVALIWLHFDEFAQRRPCGRLPRYNPRNRRAFRSEDWNMLCRRLSEEICVPQIADWLGVTKEAKPTKALQDGIDACICLLVALQLSEGVHCARIGDASSGYMIVPHTKQLQAEIHQRCKNTAREPDEWYCMHVC